MTFHFFSKSLFNGTLCPLKKPLCHMQSTTVSWLIPFRCACSDPIYYGTYQKESLQDEQEKDLIDEKGMDSEWQVIGQPTFTFVVTSMIKTGVEQGVLFGSMLTLTLLDCSEQPVCLEKSDFTKKSNQLAKSSKSKIMREYGADFDLCLGLSSYAAQRQLEFKGMLQNGYLDLRYSRRQQSAPSAFTPSDDCWGIVDMNGYEVRFKPLPPPKPPRSFTYLVEQEKLFNMP